MFRKRPQELAGSATGPDAVRALLKEAFDKRGEALKTQNYLVVRRGPFVVASVLEESVSEAPFTLTGNFIDLFQASLPVVRKRTLKPGERTLLYDLDWAKTHAVSAKVVAAAARIRSEQRSPEQFSFSARGPKGATATARILLPRAPKSVATTPSVEVKQEWDASSSTLWLSFPNTAQEVRFALSL